MKTNKSYMCLGTKIHPSYYTYLATCQLSIITGAILYWKYSRHAERVQDIVGNIHSGPTVLIHFQKYSAVFDRSIQLFCLVSCNVTGSDSFGTPPVNPSRLHVQRLGSNNTGPVLRSTMRDSKSCSRRYVWFRLKTLGSCSSAFWGLTCLTYFKMQRPLYYGSIFEA